MHGKSKQGRSDKTWVSQWRRRRDAGEDRDAGRACVEEPGVVLKGGGGYCLVQVSYRTWES